MVRGGVHVCARVQHARACLCGQAICSPLCIRLCAHVQSLCVYTVLLRVVEGIHDIAYTHDDTCARRFSDVDFDKLISKQITAPWVPEIQDPLDASNFDEYDEDDYVVEEYVDTGDGWDDDF